MHKRPNAPRPATAFVLTACALFVLLAPFCGLLGRLLAAFLARMVGAVGTGILSGTLLAVALEVGSPGLWRQLAQRLVNRKPRSVNAKAPIVNTEQSPRARRALQDVRTALKGLGYLPHEIDPVVDAIDPTMPLEKAVKAALKQLNPTN